MLLKSFYTKEMKPLSQLFLAFPVNARARLAIVEHREINHVSADRRMSLMIDRSTENYIRSIIKSFVEAIVQLSHM